MFVLALWLPAFPQEPADSVEGRRLFDALEYDQALPFLDRAIGALSRRPGATRPGAPLSSRPSRCAPARASALATARALSPTSARCSAGARLHAGRGRLATRCRDSRRSPRDHHRLHRADARSKGCAIAGGRRAAYLREWPFGRGGRRAHAPRVTNRVSSDRSARDRAGGTEPAAAHRAGATSSVVTMVTTPPGVEVFVNGVSKGHTDPAAAAGAAAAVAAQLQVPMEQVAALVLTDLTRAPSTSSSGVSATSRRGGGFPLPSSAT